ncbi:zinc carboxypeptidase, partial [Ostertagia ostertagi]
IYFCLLHIKSKDKGNRKSSKCLIQIGKKSERTKPAVWLDGGNHAREWPAFHVAVYFIEQLVQRYKIDDKITGYVESLDIYIFPVLNPDGFVFSRTSTKSIIRQWRKNRAPSNCSGSTGFAKDVCCEGVDLNRNYDLGAVRDFVLSKEVYGRLHALVSMHTHGQLWILPYNHHKRTYPEDFKELESLAARAAEKVYSYRETKYRIGTAADMLGTATGGATDWIKKNTPTKYVYVTERPQICSRTWFAFQIKPHWLIPIGKETWMGIKVIIDQGNRRDNCGAEAASEVELALVLLGRCRHGRHDVLSCQCDSCLYIVPVRYYEISGYIKHTLYKKLYI